MRDHQSTPIIHNELQDEHGVIISERHVPNLFRFFLALVKCRDGDIEAVRARLRQQGRLILQIDAVRFDDTSPALYVIREVLSQEILYAERIEFPTTEKLTAFVRQVCAIGVPIAGVVTDKEKALVAAVAEALPGVPHQYCQTHYLINLGKGTEADLAELGTAVKDVVKEVRKVEKSLNDESEGAEERETAKAVCQIVKTIGRSKGDKLLDPPQLKRYNRLQGATQQLQEAVKDRKEQWPLLARLLAILATLGAYAGLALRLQAQVDIIRHIAHILNTETTGVQAKRLLRSYLNRLERDHRKAGTPFIERVTEVSARFWKGLFVFYDTPDLPPNNNFLERFFGAVKQQQRRIHGRKSTAGGPLDGCASVILSTWARLDAHPNLLKMLEDLPPDKLLRVREEIAALAEPSRIKRSIARDPQKHLDLVLAQIAAKNKTTTST